MTKALLYPLGKSASYGRLSLKAKVLWPMLLSTSDDQGRGIAEADAVKWYVCPNVEEISIDDVPALLGEMAEQGMLDVYETDHSLAYQVVHWWEYQVLQWARPSKYPAPAGWTDRTRYSNRGDYHESDSWKTGGGYGAQPPEESPAQPPEEPPRTPAEQLPGLPTQPNLTEPNSTQLNSIDPEAAAGAARARAPPPTPVNREQWLAQLDGKSANPAMAVVRMVGVLYPHVVPPTPARAGGIAKQMGSGKNGWRRLVGLVWDCNGRKIDGDLLPYLLAVHKGKARDRGEDRAGDDKASRRAYIEGEYADAVKH